ncbi:unnamed protein product [Lactuca virosa]|uniref:Arf-GAP domain-containing protein n=1 Tax=Lactuca virosa TaxID=75947 RepID=A0AAU9PG99_9ASTR|nr:unnamed protein product [Lactuca virosa]
MGSRLKEDERNERTIRNLLKLPENRRCINCNSLGPQYVCTSFWTFVCTTCSGIHREFTHRVKSVSMAKFTTQEVSALQGGGNASAKEIYFKEWDAQRQSFPDSSNVERLRDFIKHVYVDRRYSGERSFDKPPRAKMGETTEDTYQGGSRSPPYENERRYSDRPSPGGRSDTSSRNSYDERRSPEYNNQSQDFKKSSPARGGDVVNDWRREDRFSKTPDIGRSPDRQKDISSPPLVRPVREILGESVSPLRVIEPPPKTNGGSTSLQPQRTASSSSLASSNGNPPVTELRRESSLIDFDTDDPQPTPSVASVPQTHQIPPSVPVSLNDNWANFDSTPTPTPVVTKPMPSSQAPSSGANLLDMLSELSVPASGNNPQMSLFGTNPPPPAAAVAPPSAFAPGGGPAAPSPPPFDAFGNSGGGPQWQNVQPQQNVMQPPALFNQAPPPTLDSQVTSKPAAKQELPADLFTSSYSPFGGQGAQGWYPAPQYGMGFNMQYNVPMQQQPPAFGQPPRSANPFDVNESPAVQAPTMFPSMAPLQNALPNMGPPPSGIQQAWMPPQPSHPLATPPYGSSMPSGPFMGQPPPNIPSQPQPQSRGQVGNFGYDLTSLGSMNNPNQQQQSGLYTQTPTPTPTPNTFSSNPFG